MSQVLKNEMIHKMKNKESAYSNACIMQDDLTRTPTENGEILFLIFLTF